MTRFPSFLPLLIEGVVNSKKRLQKKMKRSQYIPFFFICPFELPVLIPVSGFGSNIFMSE